MLDRLDAMRSAMLLSDEHDPAELFGTLQYNPVFQDSASVFQAKDVYPRPVAMVAIANAPPMAHCPVPRV